MAASIRGNAKDSEQNRRKAADILQTPDPIYRGSLIRYSRRCGSARCRCAKGQLHQGWALSFSRNGKTQVVYIPDELCSEVAAGLKHHKELSRLLDQIAQADSLRLRERARRYKKRRTDT